MRTILFITFTLIFIAAQAQQLQKHNYLLMAEEDSLVKVIRDPDKGIYYNFPCNCTHDKSLSFFYSPKLIRPDYTPLQEMNKIPFNWNRITLPSLIETVKKTGEIRWWENRIYFVEKDKCRNIYKIYQVTWINSNTTSEDDESYK